MKRLQSFSSISTYYSCRLKYKFKYVDKIKEETSDACQRGTDIHANIANYLLGQPYQLSNEHKSILVNFVTDELKGAQLLAVEYPIWMPREDNKKLSVVENACFYGYIDAIFVKKVRNDYKLYVVDWKSGKSQPNEKQMDYYLMLVTQSETLKRLVQKYSPVGYFIRLDMKKDETIYKKIDYAGKFWKVMYETRESTIDDVQKIEADDEYTSEYESYKCDYCYYNSMCETYKNEKNSKLLGLSVDEKLIGTLKGNINENT